ncbi:amino acid adenylation domain-containing protein, partial [Burkholderia stagnalis]
GGKTLARGYLGRAGQTAEKFIPDPFREDGSRLYRTGDLCRRREDGTIDFLGRIDQQVKLRGFRIELGEIEAALRQVAGVKQSAVELKGVGEDKRLVGYVSGEVSAAVLRAGLEGKLPGYMVPSAFVVLERLPVMQNGKIDRNALPEPEMTSVDHYVAPVGELEETLARVWAEVLGVERVGRHDNFFERGGDSIRSLKAVGAIQRAGIAVTPRQMFEHQDIAALASSIERERDHADGEHAAPPLVALPADARNALPLSYAQQRLWFLWNLQPDSGAYHIPVAMRIAGKLDVHALHGSFDALVARHESLRTTFVAGANGHATQVIHPALNPDYRTFDATARAERNAAVVAWATQLAAEPFDLTTGPLLRIGVAHLSENEHVLVVVMHHIVSDGWSAGVMLREFVDGYRARVAGQPVALPALPIQYADYAVWQRRWLEAGEREHQLAYWRARLGGEQPVLALPTDRPRQALGAYLAASETVQLPAGLSDAVHRVARAHHATPFMVLLAAFDALLHRHTGESDIRVGVPVANRNRAETEGLIGFFVNTQVLKAELDGRTTLGALLDQVKSRTLEAQAHQDLPFDVLVDALQPERRLSHTPLFQVAFNHQRNDYQAIDELDGLSVERYRLGEGEAQFELTLNAQEAADGALSVGLRYARELFDAATMERFGRHYVRVLEAFAGDLSLGVDSIDLLDDDEHASLLELSRVDARYDEGRPVHRVIQAQAAATPDAVAVEFGDAVLTYRELDVQANRLARRLIALGVGPEVRVGIAVERSVEMVVGLLAILKAGGAYVPLDPEYPRDRLAYMIEDSGIALLLTQSHVRGSLPIPAGLTTLDLDTVDLSSERDSDPEVTVDVENVAYVIYTSGSTGRPKGAANRHSALTNRLVWMQSAYGLDGTDTVLQKTPFSFDVSVWEFFWPLMVGAKLAVAQPGDHRDPAKLVSLIGRHGVTTLHFVPSMLQAFVAHDGAANCTGLKRIVCSGEALPAELANRTLDLLPEVGLYNLYGPTEAAIDVTHWTCVSGAESVPIGRPIDNVQTYVLDDALNLAPLGVAGELYLGGAGLARGYLNRPSLTAERFVPDPFGKHGERLYRTGDLARWNAEGALEYLGRIDHQVKIRGFRIELGEIEAQLSAQAEVREAVVTAQEGPGGTRLVAYVTASEKDTIDVAKLRASLSSVLPDYMVPGVIMTLERMPLSPNGKVDRKALPKAEAESAAEYEAPQGETEESLAAIWRDVLGVERIGRHDNFFELGGDSILSLQIVARARDAGWKITPRQVFEYQVLSALATSLGQTDATEADIPAIVPVPADSRDQLPLSHAQQRLWFLWNLQPESRAYHIDGALKLTGDLDLDALRGSFDALVVRHESLRTTFVARADGRAVQTIAAPDLARCDFRMADLADRGDRDDALAAWAASLTSEPFDLTAGPLLRIGVARLSADEHVLVVVMHHIVSDGWSIGVLLREFVDGYRARATGDADPQPALPIQYADYAVWQRRWLEAGEQARQLEYWRARLGGEQPVLALPTDRPRQVLGAYRAASETVQLPATLSDALHRAARRHNVTPFMLLLAAFDVLLHRYSGETDVRVGVPVANRHHHETAGLIGFFVNTQVLQAELDGRTTLAALLDQVRTRALEAQTHQDLPFDVLVDALQPERSLSHTPLFQVVFNHQRSDYRMLDRLPGLSIDPYDLGEGAAQFELALNTEEAVDGVLSVSLRYARELFDARTMARFGRHYVRVLESLTGDLNRSVDEIDLLGEAGRDELLTWGRNDIAYPRSIPVHERIHAHARSTPGAIAVVFGDASLTYAELDERSNRLAHRLAKRGVGPEVRVGIAVERSLEMIVGLLAILKAGGAYVPLDPDYPRDRLSYMIADSGISLLLTHGAVRNALPVPAALDVLELDTLDVSSEPATAPAVRVASDNLAYVIYTSGSTGRPKGAQLAHRNVARLLDATEPWFGFGPSDVWTMFHSFAFDFSVWEIFGALCHGGRLVVVPFAVSRAPEEFVELLRRERVTVLNQTPSAFRQLMKVPGLYDGEPLSLREVIFGGEALEPRTLRPWIERFGDANPRLVNMYGITETTVHVTYRPIGAADLDEGVSPVGRRIPDLGVYVLDAQRNLAPVGVTGELYVGGSGVARGYLNRAALTAERFVPDPFADDGARLYRTGDLARWTAEGALEYLGRIDHQVKIRGFRIELGEIDAQLLTQAGVREAVTLAQEGPSGTRLVSYVTAKTGHVADARTLREGLSSMLPDYMVPAAIVVLDELPLTANGKVDRKALPAPEFESSAEYEVPTGDAEEALAALWRDVLGVERVGRQDNFFELGGDSILSLQIVARARDTGWKITPRQMFERQTIALLGSVARRVDEQATHEVAVEQGNVPLLPIQSWFFETPMANRHHWNQAVLLKGAQSVDRDALGRGLEAIVAHHGALRLRYTQDETGAWHQGYAADAASGSLLWERNASDATQIAALCDEAQRSLNLTDGPLLRALLIRLPDGDWRLLLAIHHLAVDGVSWRILLDDLQSTYGQALAGGSIKLPSNGTTYQGWAERVESRAGGTEVRGELAYWRDVVDAPSRIPVDHRTGSSTIADLRHVSRQLDADATRRLLQDVPSAYRTQINDVLLTALGRALCGWTGTEAIRIDLEGHGREDLFDDVDLSRTVGWFTSLYPVKLEPQGEPGDALKRVKESLRNVPQRGLGFGLLKYLGTDSDRAALSDATPSSVVFNYLGQFDRSFASETGWQPAEEASGRAQDPDSSVTHELSISAKVFDGTLSISLSYSGARHDEATVAGLLDAYLSELHALIAHCTSGATGATPSDFPLAKLTQSELDALSMPSASIEDLYPLSPMQSGMLFHTLYAPTGSAYLNQLRIDVDGLDVARFRAAWEAVTTRHSILRTGFVQQGDAWLQWVAREVTLPFTEHDWLNRPDRAAALDALASEELSRGFDMTVAPLQRIVLIRTEANRHHLIWTHHHVL